MNVLSVFVLIPALFLNAGYPGAHIVTEWGFENCVELSNDIVRVVLDPNIGGRVLVYERAGKDVLYHPPEERGIVYQPFGDAELPWGGPGAGRFDIGPEKRLPKRPTLWVGQWTAEITGPRTAVMTSRICPDTHIRLIREFELDEKTSHLVCIQTMKNAGDREIRINHWSRTFTKGNGIALAPLDPNTRFPKGYAVYGPGQVMDFMPEDEPNVRVRDGILEIIGPPGRPKFVLDVDPGWLAYLTGDDQLFIKKFDPHIGKMSAEISAVNASIWYYRDKMCEIEPIGPMEILPPGHSASYTEHWWLEHFEFPKDRNVNLKAIHQIINDIQ